MQRKLKAAKAKESEPTEERIREEGNKKEEEPKQSKFDTSLSEALIPSLLSEQEERIHKLLKESAVREEKYIKLIGTLQEKLDSSATNYLTELRTIKEQFLTFIGAREESRRKLSFERVGVPHVKMAEGNVGMPKNRKAFTKELGSEGKLIPVLMCSVTFFYLTLLGEDYLSLHIPEKLELVFRTAGEKQQIQLHVTHEESAMDDLYNLINGIPFQISQADGHAAKVSFEITAEQLPWFERGCTQLELWDCSSAFLFALGTLELDSLLFYEDKETNWQIKPISLYCDNLKSSEIAVRLSNKLSWREKKAEKRVSSKEELTGGELSRTEARVLERINHFKQAASSVILTNTGEVDRTLLAHRRQKELEHVIQYKHNNRQTLVGQLLEEAITAFCTHELEAGTPKLIPFPIHNPDNSLLTLHVTALLASEAAFAEVEILPPVQLKKKGLYSAETDYELEDGRCTIYPASKIVIVVRCLFLQAGTHELRLTISDEFKAALETQVVKLKVQEPNPHYSFHLHNYHLEQTVFAIAVQHPTASKCLSTCAQLETSWKGQGDRELWVKVGHRGEGHHRNHLFVYDEAGQELVGSYELNIESYLRWSDVECLAVGELKHYQMEFVVGGDVLEPGAKEVWVVFRSSHPGCEVTCMNRKEIPCQPNVLYKIDVGIRLFYPVKHLLIHALINDRIAKKWLLTPLLAPAVHQNTFEIRCKRGVTVKYPFEIQNNTNEQQLFTLHSSNKSVLRVINSVPLMSKQFLTIDLEIIVERNIEKTNVILALCNADKIVTYLFKIVVYV